MVKLSNFSNTENSVVTVDNLVSDTSGSDGVNDKFIAKRIKDGKLGILKYPVNRFSKDHVMECIVYDLAKLFGINCCTATLEIFDNKECVLSEFYKDGKFESCRHLLGSNSVRDFNKRFNMKFLENKIGPKAVDDFVRMVFLDLITMQVDRHISNFGFKDNRMYPLFDNGRCLFYDSPKEEIPRGDFNFAEYLVNNEHGYGFSYLDTLSENYLNSIINLKVEKIVIEDVFDKWLPNDKELVKLLTNFVWRMFTSIIWWR